MLQLTTLEKNAAIYSLSAYLCKYIDYLECDQCAVFDFSTLTPYFDRKLSAISDMTGRGIAIMLIISVEDLKAYGGIIEITNDKGGLDYQITTPQSVFDCVLRAYDDKECLYDF